MIIDRKKLSTLAAAALVLLSAALCAATTTTTTTTASQHGKPSRRGTRTTTTTPAKTKAQTTTPAAPQEPSTQQTPVTDDATPTPPAHAPAAKRNTRETTVDDSATAGAASDDEKAGAKDAKGVSVKTSATAMTVASDAEAVSYAYEFKRPEMTIHHIRIEHDAAGRGRISFERITDTEPLVEPFVLSAAALARIKSLWEALRFLDSTENYQTERQYAHLGTLRLRMKQGKRERVAEFNWTHNQDASKLVNEYRHAAEQAILVFEIGVALELQPLEMARLMNRFAALLDRDSLSDPQQLLPLLRELQTDERVPLIARNHAARLLKKIEKDSPKP